MSSIASALAAGFALTAAGLWLMATIVHSKAEAAVEVFGRQQTLDVLDGAQRQLGWIKWAAFAASAAALAQALAAMLSCCVE